MYAYIIGKIIGVHGDEEGRGAITFESNYIGYDIRVSNTEKYEVGKVKKLYLYKHMTTNNKNALVEDLFGFESFEQKEFFLGLLSISGVGPITALTICSNDLETVGSLLDNGDTEGLAQLKGISPKYAKLIVERFTPEEPQRKNDETEDKMIKAMKSLGYAKNDINYMLDNLDRSDPKAELSDLLSQGIKKIAERDKELKPKKTMGMK
ncbi:MAG: hypothetical protein LBT17_00855 [Mycoplasmataceae bacterium]|jgi:Holliday junction DNA helicase RuvA|nr:hypothetical protein [Mycoplasmataceae bacterium]